MRGSYRAILFASVALSAALFVLWSWRWPLVGDASQIHYICFLMDHGMAPYRVTGDMNMPGALLVEWAVMHTLGPGGFAWRAFDLLTVAGMTAAMAVIAGRGHRLAALGAGCLFLVIHGADGINDLGERDLTVAALFLIAYAFLFVALRRRQAWPGFFFGLCASAAVAVKPTLAPLALLLLALAAWRTLRLGLIALAGAAIPVALTLALLVRESALGAFWHSLRTVVPYYASLAHRPLDFLLVHSMAPILPMMVGWLLITAAVRKWRSFESIALGAGVLFGLFSYLIQAKGFPYFRYPLLAFALLLIAVDGDAAVRLLRPRRVILLGAATLAYGAFFVAPVSAWKAHHFQWWDEEFISSLSADLGALHAKDGEVQCIDSISGCGTTLLRLHLVQATGMLSDFFIFGPERRAVIEARQAFTKTLAQDGPPRIMIVTSRLHLLPEGDNWAKLDRWPWFGEYLAAHYTLVLTRRSTRPTRWGPRPAPAASYRIYVRKDAAD